MGSVPRAEAQGWYERGLRILHSLGVSAQPVFGCQGQGSDYDNNSALLHCAAGLFAGAQRYGSEDDEAAALLIVQATNWFVEAAATSDPVQRGVLLLLFLDNVNGAALGDEYAPAVTDATCALMADLVEAPWESLVRAWHRETAYPRKATASSSLNAQEEEEYRRWYESMELDRLDALYEDVRYGRVPPELVYGPTEEREDAVQEKHWDYLAD